MEVTAYRGGHDGRWLSEDRDHAAYFGDVSEREISCDDDYVLHAGPSDVQEHFEEEMGGHGMPMAGTDEECLLDMAACCDHRVDWICLHDWEGSGRVYFRV